MKGVRNKRNPNGEVVRPLFQGDAAYIYEQLPAASMRAIRFQCFSKRYVSATEGNLCDIPLDASRLSNIESLYLSPGGNTPPNLGGGPLPPWAGQSDGGGGRYWERLKHIEVGGPLPPGAASLANLKSIFGEWGLEGGDGGEHASCEVRFCAKRFVN